MYGNFVILTKQYIPTTIIIRVLLVEHHHRQMKTKQMVDRKELGISLNMFVFQLISSAIQNNGLVCVMVQPLLSKLLSDNESYYMLENDSMCCVFYLHF